MGRYVHGVSHVVYLTLPLGVRVTDVGLIHWSDVFNISYLAFVNVTELFVPPNSTKFMRSKKANASIQASKWFLCQTLNKTHYLCQLIESTLPNHTRKTT